MHLVGTSKRLPGGSVGQLSLPREEEYQMKEEEQRKREVLASCCGCNQYPPGQWLKTRQTCPFSGSGGQRSTIER